MKSEQAMSRKHNKFVATQEAFRKDVKRAFIVLSSRFHILKQPFRMWSREKMIMVMKVCIIMRNMIVELHRGQYSSHLWELAMSVVRRNSIIHQDENEILFNSTSFEKDSLYHEAPASTIANKVASRNVRIIDEGQLFRAQG